MGRRTRPRRSWQKHKHLKRPRSWHRICLKTVEELSEELGVTKKEVACSHCNDCIDKCPTCDGFRYVYEDDDEQGKQEVPERG